MLHKAVKIGIALLGILSMYFGWSVFMSGTAEGIVSPLPQSDLAAAEPSPAPQTPTVKPSGLSAIVAKSLVGTSGTYGIVIKNLKTGETYAQNEHTVFETASLYKLWVASVVYDWLEQEKLSKDKQLSAGVATLNSAFDIDPENAERTDGVVSFTVAQALEQMITISHNYAALLLHYTVKNASVNAFLAAVGLNESKTGEPPQTTAADIALFYEKLYEGKIVNVLEDKDMMELLARQQFNDRIPKYLPKGTKVAHKTGELGEYKHDAGIVFSPKGEYVIVVLSKSDNPAVAAEREAKLSQVVYDYFSR